MRHESRHILQFRDLKLPVLYVNIFLGYFATLRLLPFTKLLKIESNSNMVEIESIGGKKDRGRYYLIF